MRSSVFSRTLQRAAELIGGRDVLCKELRVSPGELQRWIADESRPPRAVFLRAVTLILDATDPQGGGETADPPASRDCSSGADSTSACFD